jgi:hypothetical protein
MRTTGRALCALSISLVSILALSCDNAYGVFQQVQLEKKQVGNTVFQETGVYNAFRLGNYYYAATATLNRTTVGADSWSTVAINGSTSYSLRSAVLAGDYLTGTIYALIETGVEKSSTISVYSSTDGNTWTGPLSSQPGYNSNLISNYDALFAANGCVYAENHSYNPNSYAPTSPGQSTYTLFQLVPSPAQVTGSTGTFCPSAPPTVDLDKSIRGVVFDGSSKYWFASENKLFSGISSNGSDATDSSSTFTGLFSSSSYTVWGISYSGSPGHLYVTTKNGHIYKDGGSAANPVGLPLTQVIEVPSASGTIPTILLVGTDSVPPTTLISAATAQGYFECNVDTFPTGFVGGGSGQVTSNSSLYATTVNIAPVHSFFYDPVVDPVVGNRLFICVSPGTSSTSYYGLYESDWNGSSWSGWTAR